MSNTNHGSLFKYIYIVLLKLLSSVYFNLVCQVNNVLNVSVMRLGTVCHRKPRTHQKFDQGDVQCQHIGRLQPQKGCTASRVQLQVSSPNCRQKSNSIFLEEYVGVFCRRQPWLCQEVSV